MIAAILIGLILFVAGIIVLFVVATATGTIVGIIGGIVQGTRARRAAAAAGVPYRRLTYQQARAERLARLNATINIPGARHQAVPTQPTHAPGQDTQS